MKIILRDIMQAYIQSKIELNHTVICYLSAKLKKKYLEDTVLCVVKPLYSLAEAGNHWFATYLDHHKENLGMKISSYDTCLFIFKNGDKNFGIAGLQTNNILNIGTKAFIKKEEIEIMEAKFKAKTQTILETGASKDFNGCRMIIKAESIMIV